MNTELNPENKPEILSDEQRKALGEISSRIEKAAQSNDSETVRYLRKQLIDAAKLGIISANEALDAALPPFMDSEKKKR